jgi:hypothetical protein
MIQALHIYIQYDVLMIQALHIYKKIGPQLYILEGFYIFRERDSEKGNPIND